MIGKAFSEAFTSTQRSYQSGSLFDGFSLFGSGPGVKTSASNYKSSLKIAAVFNAVDQISNDLAKIPFGVYFKNGDDREANTNHPVHKLIAQSPNDYMTPFHWKKTMWTSALLRGNGISVIKVNAAGYPVSLDFVNFDDVYNIYKKDGQILYSIKGYDRPLLSSEVVHLKLFSHNGIVGVSVITYAAQQLNIALELQDYTATLLENKGISRGVITTDKEAKPEAKLKIINGFRNAMAEKSPERVAVLDEGMQFNSISISPKDAQIVELKEVTVEDIARWFNIAPHKIKSLKQSTNNNIEQQTLDHASDTIQPHTTNFEQELAFKLFTQADINRGAYIRGNINVLLRSDMRARAEMYSKAIYFGWMSRNEVRKLEEMNQGPDLLNEFLTPTNAYTEELLNNQNNKNGNNV